MKDGTRPVTHQEFTRENNYTFVAVLILYCWLLILTVAVL